MKDGHYFNEYQEEVWVQGGKLHREDGPAVIESNGTLWWFQNDEHHREDGPAIHWPDGSQHWYTNGVLHRLDGPAIIDGDEKEYWIDGTQYDNDLQWRIEVQRLKRKEKEKNDKE